jgi:hypothetical protein
VARLTDGLHYSIEHSAIQFSGVYVSILTANCLKLGVESCRMSYAAYDSVRHNSSHEVRQSLSRIIAH